VYKNNSSIVGREKDIILEKFSQEEPNIVSAKHSANKCFIKDLEAFTKNI
jgi:hypothetical protein